MRALLAGRPGVLALGHRLLRRVHRLEPAARVPAADPALPAWDGGPVEGADTVFGIGDAAAPTGAGSDDGWDRGEAGEPDGFGTGDEPRYATDDHPGGWDGNGWGGFDGGFDGF